MYEFIKFLEAKVDPKYRPEGRKDNIDIDGYPKTAFTTHHHARVNGRHVITTKGKAIVLAEFIRHKMPGKPRGCNQVVLRMQEDLKTYRTGRAACLFQKVASKKPPKNKGEEYTVIRFLLRKTVTSKPYDVTFPDAFIAISLEYLTRELYTQASARKSFKEIVDKDYRRPSDMGKALIKVTKDLHGNPNRPSYVDPSLVGITTQLLDYNISKIRQALQDESKPNLVCLYGDSSSGRTTILRTILAEFQVVLKPDERIGFLRNGADEMDPNRTLSVFALNCREKSAPEILTSVDMFLNDGLPVLATPRNHKARLEAMEAKAKDRPALFVFIGLEVSSTDPTQASIKDVNVRDLIHTLAMASPINRVAITQLEPYRTDFEKSQGLAVIDVEIPARAFKDLAGFFKYEHETLRSVKSRLEGDYAARADMEVSGAVLSLAVSAIRLAAASTDRKRLDVCVTETVKLINDYLIKRGTQKAALHGTEHANQRRTLCSQIWDVMQPDILERNKDLDDILPHIAASDDGLTASTLFHLFREDDPATAQERYETVKMELDRLVDITKGRLVFRSESEIENVLETDPRERDQYFAAWAESADVQRSKIRYIIDGPSARGLMRAVRLEDDGDYAKTYRDIAGIARRRSELIKMQIERIYGEERRDLNRDILSYVALLASLDKKSIQESRLEEFNESPAFEESAIFSFPNNRSDYFNGDEAKAEVGVKDGGNKAEAQNTVNDVDRLRFAYFVMIGRDLDRDHRLTMKLDEDELRMTLLLHLFHGVGLRHRGPAVRSLKIPEELPEHLVAAFSPGTQASILTSLGISCLYADHPKRLQDVVLLSESFAKSHDLFNENLTDKNLDRARYDLLRLWEADLDGTFLGYSDGQSGQSGWHALHDKIEAARQRIPEMSKFYEMSMIRLDVQQLRLDAFQSAAKSDILARVEAIISHAASVTPIGQTTDARLSGRNTRKMIKSLLGEPAFEADPNMRQDTTYKPRIMRARNLLRINIARLSEYSGGDRVGTLVDRALIAAFSHDWLGAEAFIDQASDDILYQSLSQGLRADLLWHHAQILFASAQYIQRNSGDDGDDTVVKFQLEKSEQLTRALLNLTKIDFPYYRAGAQLLLGGIHRRLGQTVDRSQLDGAYRVLRGLGATRMLESIDAVIGKQLADQLRNMKM